MEVNEKALKILLEYNVLELELTSEDDFMEIDHISTLPMSGVWHGVSVSGRLEQAVAVGRNDKWNGTLSKPFLIQPFRPVSTFEMPR